MLSLLQHLALLAALAAHWSGGVVGDLRIVADQCSAEQLVRGQPFDDVFRVIVEPPDHRQWTALEFAAQVTNRSLLAASGASIPHRATVTVLTPKEASSAWRVAVSSTDAAVDERITLLSVSRPADAEPTDEPVIFEIRVSYLPDARGCYGALGIALLTSVTLFKSDAPAIDAARQVYSARCPHLQDVECARESRLAGEAAPPPNIRRRYTLFGLLCAVVALLIVLR